MILFYYHTTFQNHIHSNIFKKLFQKKQNNNSEGQGPLLALGPWAHAHFAHAVIRLCSMHIASLKAALQHYKPEHYNVLKKDGLH